MALRFAAFIAGAVALSACSGGSGELVTNVAGGRDDPGATRDPPPSSGDNPGGACIVCDVNYDCSGPAPFGGSNLQLSTGGGTCLPSLINVLCSGALFNASGCTGGGGGPFTCGDTTCSPGSSQSNMFSGGGPVATVPPSQGASGSSGFGSTASGAGSEPDAG